MPNRFPSCCGNSTKRGNWPASRKRRRAATSWWKRPLGRRNSAPYWLHFQNRILPANSKSLGFPALVMVPKAALPNEPLGSLSGGVLLTLKTSARNSRLTRSDIRNVLPIIRSASCSPGPRTGFRELLPMLNCPAAAKADLSNHSPALRFAKAFGLPIANRPLNRVPERGQGIRRLRDQHRVSRLDAHEATDFPAVDLPPSRNPVHQIGRASCRER